MRQMSSTLMRSLAIISSLTLGGGCVWYRATNSSAPADSPTVTGSNATQPSSQRFSPGRLMPSSKSDSATFTASPTLGEPGSIGANQPMMLGGSKFGANVISIPAPTSKPSEPTK